MIYVFAVAPRVERVLHDYHNRSNKTSRPPQNRKSLYLYNWFTYTHAGHLKKDFKYFCLSIYLKLWGVYEVARAPDTTQQTAAGAF